MRLQEIKRDYETKKRRALVLPTVLAMTTALACGFIYKDVQSSKVVYAKQRITNVSDIKSDANIKPVISEEATNNIGVDDDATFEIISSAYELVEESNAREAELQAERERIKAAEQERIKAEQQNTKSASTNTRPVTRTLNARSGDIVDLGVKQVPQSMYQYTDIIARAASKFNVDPNVVMSLLSQESGGDIYCDTATSAGIAQIDSCLADSFIQFGMDYYGQTWDLNDRYNPKCAIPYCTYVLSTYLEHYDGDYLKAIQAYNFSHYSLDKLINAYGDSWIYHTDEIAYYNGHYDRTGSTRYGDPNYVRNVLGFYSDII